MSKALESSFGGNTPTSSVPPPESKKREKAIPNYLRASTGSCHDLCKYGHKSPSEQETKFLGGRTRKLPTQINNLALHRSAILDRSKDVLHRTVSLAKSSISLGEAERVAPKIASADWKGVASDDRLVSRTATSTNHKNLISDGRKKHSMVAQKAPTNPRYSNGLPISDKKSIVPVKSTIVSAKSKLPEKNVPEKSKTVDKVAMTKQSLLKKPASSPTQVATPSQASGHHLLSSKDKSTPKGNVTSQRATITRVPAKPGPSPTRSRDANINRKKGLDMPESSFSSMEPKLTASVEILEDHMQGTGHYVESTLADLSSGATECVDSSQPTPEATKSISEDDGVGRNEKTEALVNDEAPMESPIALELQQSLDDQELHAAKGESDPEHKLAEQSFLDGRASKNEDNQTGDAVLCQLSEQLTNVKDADTYDPLTESISKIQGDQVKAYTHAESLICEGKEEVGAHEDVQRSPELLALDESHSEEPESCPDLASGNAAESDKANEVLNDRMNSCAPHFQSISETSSDGELLKEPKSMLTEPSDSTVQIDVVASVSKTFEQDGLKSRTFIPQSPEELSDDEFYEEYDFELSESDESDTEDGEATTDRTKGDSLKAGNQRTRRISGLELDDTNITPYKLKFKRGKIVELPPDSSGPRRLKFRRKATNEVSNGGNQPLRRIYKRNSTNNAIPADPDEESSGVKLRHQDAQEKKDAQGLFNNVIEETASKLVESRKSKVKALVGAFETVILLQDGKPTSSTPQAGNSQDSVHDDGGYAPEEAE